MHPKNTPLAHRCCRAEARQPGWARQSSYTRIWACRARPVVLWFCQRQHKRRRAAVSPFKSMVLQHTRNDFSASCLISFASMGKKIFFIYYIAPNYITRHSTRVQMTCQDVVSLVSANRQGQWTEGTGCPGTQA